jgi:ribonuclease HII
MKADLEDLRARIAAAIERENPTHIIGVDEVGYGACAGPLVIGAVCVPRDWKAPEWLTDSKLLSAKQIGALASEFKASGEWCSILFCHSDEIDQCGLGRLRKIGLEAEAENAMTMCEAFSNDNRPLAFVDGNIAMGGALSFPKADLLVPACSMASVIAKHARDLWMIEAAKKYPGYGFDQSMGYDTPQHREALGRLGLCPIHRRSNRTVTSAERKVMGPNEDVSDLIWALSQETE